jgi:hypothetical protein
MPKTASSRNMFRCEPCREIVLFFDVWRDNDSKAPHHAQRPVDQVRAA